MGIAFIAIGVLFAVLAVASKSRRLRRNGIAGMRTKATMASDEAWRASHEASAWSVALDALIFIAGGIVMLLTDARDESIALATSVLILPVTIAGGVHADRVARAVTAGNGGGA
jgi:hypothetical protein